MNKEAVAEFERAKKEKEEKGERVEEKDKVRAVIPLESCLSRLCQEEQVCDFLNIVCHGFVNLVFLGDNIENKLLQQMCNFLPSELFYRSQTSIPPR